VQIARRLSKPVCDGGVINKASGHGSGLQIARICAVVSSATSKMAKLGSSVEYKHTSD